MFYLSIYRVNPRVVTHAHPANVPQAHLSSLNAEELTTVTAPDLATTPRIPFQPLLPSDKIPPGQCTAGAPYLAECRRLYHALCAKFCHRRHLYVCWAAPMGAARVTLG